MCCTAVNNVKNNKDFNLILSNSVSRDYGHFFLNKNWLDLLVKYYFYYWISMYFVQKLPSAEGSVILDIFRAFLLRWRLHFTTSALYLLLLPMVRNSGILKFNILRLHRKRNVKIGVDNLEISWLKWLGWNVTLLILDSRSLTYNWLTKIWY